MNAMQVGNFNIHFSPKGKTSSPAKPDKQGNYMDQLKSVFAEKTKNLKEVSAGLFIPNYQRVDSLAGLQMHGQITQKQPPV